MWGLSSPGPQPRAHTYRPPEDPGHRPPALQPARPNPTRGPWSQVLALAWTAVLTRLVLGLLPSVNPRGHGRRLRPRSREAEISGPPTILPQATRAHVCIASRFLEQVQHESPRFKGPLCRCLWGWVTVKPEHQRALSRFKRGDPVIRLPVYTVVTASWACRWHLKGFKMMETIVYVHS